MGYKDSNTNKLILGAILGGVIVGTSAIYLSTKQGKKLRNQATDKLQDFKEQLQDFLGSLNDKSKSLACDMSDRAGDYACKIQDFATQIREQIEGLGESEDKDRLTGLMIGAVVGALLGAGASAWLNSDSKDKSDLFKNLGTSAGTLKRTISDILSVLQDKASFKGNRSSNAMKDILDFATTGVQLWQKFQNK